jgi:CcmD family protein
MDQRNFMYMFYGFAAAWAILVIYVLMLVAREGRLRRELDRLRTMIGDRR